VFDKNGKPLTPPEGITFDGRLGLMQGTIVTPSRDVWALGISKRQLIHFPKSDWTKGRIVCEGDSAEPCKSFVGPFHLAPSARPHRRQRWRQCWDRSVKSTSMTFQRRSISRRCDGARLQYYAYLASPDKVAVLVHGSAGPETSMHALAKALRDAGVSAYVLDIRGHGASGRRGDIDYIGQIDDDLADFVTNLGSAKSGEVRTLVGFSAGAGFTIRFAGGRYSDLFDRYVFLSPILPGAPTLRPNAGGWTRISLPTP
jgi:pimeloyl-ACP methyl ester carboxylesterase